MEEELLRVKYTLSEGDAAAYLPSKSHGFVHIFFCFLFYIHSYFVHSRDMEVCIGEIFVLISTFLVSGRFLRMFLGPINVRANRKDIQLKVKEEYNGFRVCFLLIVIYYRVSS